MMCDVLTSRACVRDADALQAIAALNPYPDPSRFSHQYIHTSADWDVYGVQ